jgi:hypothetical protein
MLGRSDDVRLSGVDRNWLVPDLNDANNPKAKSLQQLESNRKSNIKIEFT